MDPKTSDLTEHLENTDSTGKVVSSQTLSMRHSTGELEAKSAEEKPRSPLSPQTEQTSQKTKPVSHTDPKPGNLNKKPETTGSPKNMQIKLQKPEHA